MLEGSLSRRTVLAHAATAVAGAGSLGVADRATDDPPQELDVADPDHGCGDDRIDPDVAVVGARDPGDVDEAPDDAEARDALDAPDAEYVVRAGDAVTFDAGETTSRVPVASFAWTFPGGTDDGTGAKPSETVEGERVHHAFERAGGVAEVTLTVTDRAGRSATASVRVAVLPRDRYNRAPTPVHSVSPTRTYDDGYVARAGERLTFDARESADPDGDVVDYEWEFRGGAKHGAVVEHAFRRAGNHEVALSVTDDDGASEHVEIPIHVTR